MPPVVAPGTQRTRLRRESRVQCGTGPQRRTGAFGIVRQGLGTAQMTAQRALVVLGCQHGASGNMVQLDPPARPPQCPRRRERVQGERLGCAGVVLGERPTAGLVVNDDERTVTVVEPVDPSGQGQPFGAGGHLAFHPHRFTRRIKAGHVPPDHLSRPLPPANRLVAVPPAVGYPPEADEMRRTGRGTACQRLVPPGSQGVVHAGAHRVVGPRRAFRWRRAVQVGHPVTARAISEGGKFRRRAHEKSPRHTVQLQLVHDMILSLGHQPATTGPRQPARYHRPTAATMSIQR